MICNSLRQRQRAFVGCRAQITDTEVETQVQQVMHPSVLHPAVSSTHSGFVPVTQIYLVTYSQFLFNQPIFHVSDFTLCH